MSCTSDKACPPDTHNVYCDFPFCAYGIKKAAILLSPPKAYDKGYEAGYNSGFKAGAEAMRERAAKVAPGLTTIHIIEGLPGQPSTYLQEPATPERIAAAILALPVEE